MITRSNLNFGKRTIRKNLILKNTLHIHVYLSGQPSNSNDRCLSIDFDQFDIDEPSETHCYHFKRNDDYLKRQERPNINNQ